MKEQTRRRCVSLIANRKKLKHIFFGKSRLMHLVCAAMYTLEGIEIEEESLKASKKLLKRKVGPFSYFRRTAYLPIVAMIDRSTNPEELIDQGLKVYKLLKEDLIGSSYLALSALIIAQKAEPEEYEQVVNRTLALYKKIKKGHRFLTSGEDTTSCALMALSDKTDEELLEDADACYSLLIARFHSANAVQSLSNILALYEGSAQEKCNRTFELFDRLKANGCKYGTWFELPTLGVLAMAEAKIETITMKMLFGDEWLSKEGELLGKIGRKQRLMYAGILAQQDCMVGNTLQIAVVNGTIALIVARQAAMYAVVLEIVKYLVKYFPQ